MVIDPELVPELVSNVRSPVPLVVIVALAFESPTLTVSAVRYTSPVPLGAISILALLVLIMLLPLTSKLPPNCGVRSSTTFSNFALFKFVMLASPSAQVNADPLLALV